MTHICVSRPQCVKSLGPCDAYHICISKLTIIGSDNRLSTGPLGTNFSEILIKIQNFLLKKMLLETSSAKWRPFCPRGNELTSQPHHPLTIALLHLRLYMHLHTCTVETLYNTVNFCWSTHKRHSIARPKGRGMGCILWVQRATYCVDLSKLSSMKYLL